MWNSAVFGVANGPWISYFCLLGRFRWRPVAGCVNCMHFPLGSIEGFPCEPVHRCTQAFHQLWTCSSKEAQVQLGLTGFSSPKALPGPVLRLWPLSLQGWAACGLAVVPSMECRSWAQVPEVTFQEALLISSIWKTRWMAGPCPETQGVGAAVCRCHQ